MLPQVMVKMPVAPDLPIAPVHLSEQRVRSERLAGGKFLHCLTQFRGVALPIGWRRATASLFDFWARWKTVGPRRGCAQRDPLDDGASERICGGAHLCLADAHAEGVGQVADHLTRGLSCASRPWHLARTAGSASVFGGGLIAFSRYTELRCLHATARAVMDFAEVQSRQTGRHSAAQQQRQGKREEQHK
jgi:hypothetical protein